MTEVQTRKLPDHIKIESEMDIPFTNDLINKLNGLLEKFSVERKYQIRDLQDEGAIGIDYVVEDILKRKLLIGKSTQYLKLIREFHATDSFGFLDMAELCVGVVKWSLIKGKSLQSCAVKLGDSIIKNLPFNDDKDSLSVRNKRRFKIGDWLMVSLRNVNIIDYRIMFTSDDLSLIQSYKATKANLGKEHARTKAIARKVNTLFFRSSLMVVEGTHKKASDSLKRMYLEIEDSKTDYKTMPYFGEIPEYTEFYNEKLRAKLLKGLPTEYESYFTYKNCPLLFDAFNYIQSTEFCVDKDLLDLTEEFKREEIKKYSKFQNLIKESETSNINTEKYPLTLRDLDMDLDKLEVDELAKIKELCYSKKKEASEIKKLGDKVERKRQGIKSKRIEVDESISMGKKIQRRCDREGIGFRQPHFGCYRIRKYPKVSFFHTQGSKTARGHINMNEGKPLGVHGWESLLKGASSNYGLDKKPQEERLNFANDNLESGLWMSAISDPHNEKYKDFWDKADNVVGFRGDLIAIKKALDFEDLFNGVTRYQYPSNRIVYLDFCTSLIMIMSAMVGDKEGLKWSNCLKKGIRYDSYEKIADLAFEEIKFTDSEKAKLEESISKLKDLTDEYDKMDKSNKKDPELIKVRDKIKYRRKRVEDFQSLRFWSDPKFAGTKLRRALVKRNVMLVFYGSGVSTGSKYIMKENEFDVDFAMMNKSHAKFITERVRKACTMTFPGAIMVMDVIRRMAEIKFEKGEDFVITEELTKGRMHLQGRYVKTEQVPSSFIRYKKEVVDEDGIVRKTYSLEEVENSKKVYHQPRIVVDEISLDSLNKAISTISDTTDEKETGRLVTLNAKKAKMKADVITAAVTAVIHFYDATILRVFVLKCKEQGIPVSVIHDSVGVLPADILEAWNLGREGFLDTIRSNPFKMLLKDPDFKQDPLIQEILDGYGNKVWEKEDTWESYMSDLTEGVLENEFNLC